MFDSRVLAEAVEQATREEIPGLIGELEAAKAAAWQRIIAPPPVRNADAPMEPDGDSMLTKRDVLGLCGRADDKTESWVDQQVRARRLSAHREPGTVRDGVKLPGKGVRFRRPEVMRFLREEYKSVSR